MDISIGQNSFKNQTIAPDVTGAGQTAGAGAVANSGASVSEKLQIKQPQAEAWASEPVADVPDSALRRDDDLGKLISAAFSLPPPPMPELN